MQKNAWGRIKNSLAVCVCMCVEIENSDTIEQP